jgi:hypothetical protein
MPTKLKSAVLTILISAGTASCALAQEKATCFGGNRTYVAYPGKPNQRTYRSTVQYTNRDGKPALHLKGVVWETDVKANLTSALVGQLLPNTRVNQIGFKYEDFYDNGFPAYPVDPIIRFEYSSAKSPEKIEYSTAYTSDCFKQPQGHAKVVIYNLKEVDGEDPIIRRVAIVGPSRCNLDVWDLKVNNKNIFEFKTGPITDMSKDPLLDAE